MTQPPALWTSWRDKRDETIVTVVGVHLWDDAHFAALRVECDPERRWLGSVVGLKRAEFEEHFVLAYDPHTGFDEIERDEALEAVR